MKVVYYVETAWQPVSVKSTYTNTHSIRCYCGIGADNHTYEVLLIYPYLRQQTERKAVAVNCPECTNPRTGYCDETTFSRKGKLFK